jgi:hypothetical protein
MVIPSNDKRKGRYLHGWMYTCRDTENRWTDVSKVGFTSSDLIVLLTVLRHQFQTIETTATSHSLSAPTLLRESHECLAIALIELRFVIPKLMTRYANCYTNTALSIPAPATIRRNLQPDCVLNPEIAPQTNT